MPKASVVATELRRLADSLDKEPEAEIRRPCVSFYHWDESERDKFLALARLLPRPLKKDYTDQELKLSYESEGVWVYTQIPRNTICRLVAPAIPAQYECDPILSEAELSEVEG